MLDIQAQHGYMTRNSKTTHLVVPLKRTLKHNRSVGVRAPTLFNILGDWGIDLLQIFTKELGPDKVKSTIHNLHNTLLRNNGELRDLIFK